MTGRLAAALAAVLVLAMAGCRDQGDDAGSEPSYSATSESTATPPDGPSATADPHPSPQELGFDPKVLDGLAQKARSTGSTCFLVARNGEVAGEWYWGDGSSTTPAEVFSVTKSFTSTLVGIAQADGDLSIDDPASDYIPEWRGTDSEAVTVRHLLSNDSGRYWTTESDYGALLQAKDRTAYAVGLSQTDPPGTVWAYNNAAIQTLDEVIENATGEKTYEFAQERLFGPLGMTHTRMTLDASKQSTQAFFGLQSTCPDLARFGQLFAQQGRWDGEQIVPKAWVEDATGRSSQRLNAAYGLLWWVNREGPLRDPVDADDPGLPPGVATVGQLVPDAPEDMYAALGFGGQVVLVDPGSGTVVVRLGPGGVDTGYGIGEAAEVVTEALEE